MQFGSGTTLVHLRASPEVIRRRMDVDPHPRAVLQAKDVEYVLERFQAEYERAVYFNRIELDTSTASVEDTLAEWVEKMDPYWTKSTGCGCSRTAERTFGSE